MYIRKRKIPFQCWPRWWRYGTILPNEKQVFGRDKKKCREPWTAAVGGRRVECYLQKAVEGVPMLLLYLQWSGVQCNRRRLHFWNLRTGTGDCRSTYHSPSSRKKNNHKGGISWNMVQLMRIVFMPCWKAGGWHRSMSIPAFTASALAISLFTLEKAEICSAVWRSIG